MCCKSPNENDKLRLLGTVSSSACMAFASEDRHDLEHWDPGRSQRDEACLNTTAIGTRIHHRLAGTFLSAELSPELRFPITANHALPTDPRSPPSTHALSIDPRPPPSTLALPTDPLCAIILNLRLNTAVARTCPVAPLPYQTFNVLQFPEVDASQPCITVFASCGHGYLHLR